MHPSQVMISFKKEIFPIGETPPTTRIRALIGKEVFWLIVAISYPFFSDINFVCNHIVLHLFQKDFEIFRQSRLALLPLVPFCRVWSF